MRTGINEKRQRTLRGATAMLLTAMVLFVCAAPSQAQNAGGCDPQFMQSLKGRGNAEAKRLSAQNKNLIYKPDSVLEYSCFFSFVAHAQNNVSMPISPGPWDNIVTSPAFEYVANNFGHVYLGGRFAPNGPEVPEGDYVCDAMSRLWEFARCINNQQFGNSENSFDFSWYIDNDPRVFPPEYAACTPTMNPIDLKDAFNGREAEWAGYLGFGDAETYKIDPVQTYLAQTDWTVDDACGAPIPTGLRIYRSERNYPEYVCAKPGCTYVPGAADALGTCVK